MVTMPSVKIPDEDYRRLKLLKFKFFEKHNISVQIVELLRAILNQVDWETFEAAILAEKQAGAEKNKKA